MNKPFLLITEDDLAQLGRMLVIAQEARLEARGANTLSEAKKCLASKPVEILLTDIHLSGSREQNSYEGLELLAFVKEHYPEVICLAMSADPKIETYEKALAQGATQFLRKPILNADELSIALDQARSKKALERAASLSGSPKLPESLLTSCPDGVLLSEQIRTLCAKVAANRKIPVVLYGETGVGKEVVARLIHRLRVASEGCIPFVAVNCANLTQDLAVSQLFGHRKGAFTGADQATVGLIGEANGGILFLDEIHHLSLPSQQKLLRVLNDGTYERLGETKPQRSTFQVIAASTQDLDEAVERGEFLLDLRMRITGIDFAIPPLRERLSDLPILVGLFFAKERLTVAEAEIIKIAERCAQFHWRGNVRQLFQVLQALLVMSSCNSEEIKADNLPIFKSMLENKRDQYAAITSLGAQGIPADSLGKLANFLENDAPLEGAIDFFEKLVIQGAIARHPKLADALQILQVSRSTLDAKRKKYGLG